VCFSRVLTTNTGKQRGKPVSRILVVDDSLIVRTILEISLSREGFTVISCPDGPSAVEFLSDLSEDTPDLIILDRTLPRWDEVLRHVKSQPDLCQIAVLMLLPPDAGLVDRLKWKLAGAARGIHKPFKTQEILAAVLAHLPEGQASKHGHEEERPALRERE
jgi:DNA-binding response OmpR family regulator